MRIKYRVIQQQYFYIVNLAAASLAIVIAVMIVLAAVTSATAAAKYTGIVVDAKTGKVLYAHNADSYRHPASLAKMMTLYMVFDRLDRGELKKSTLIRMSRRAASMQPSKLGIKAGGKIKVEHAIYALVTKSANDVAAALAEHIGGSEAGFARMMTTKARQLGMRRTTFKNASGLTAKGQLTTARDMATLGIALREHFPDRYHYFSKRSFKYGRHRYGNHNRLLGKVTGVDGIKTGYTKAAGFNLVTSVKHGGRQIVAVVMGGRTGKSRNAQMQNLVSRHLRKATRRDKKIMLVARAEIAVPNAVPTPQFRALAAATAPIALAQNTAATGVGSTALAFAPETTDEDSRIREQLVALGIQSTPIPAPKPARAAQNHTSPTPSKPVLNRPDQIVTASVASLANQPASAWHVQIAATPSLKTAETLLAHARGKAPQLLAATFNYTETVEKNGVTLFRARFAGFSTKQSARQVCAGLKKKKVDCLAVPNRRAG